VEWSLRSDAEREHIPVEEVVARRLREAELLRRIFAYFPPAETRETHSLARKRQAAALSEAEAKRFTEQAHSREEKNAQRFADILALAQLRGVRYRNLMNELGIRPQRKG
jgi:hypothetical protein